jgi:hypothetical protein
MIDKLEDLEHSPTFPLGSFGQRVQQFALTAMASGPLLQAVFSPKRPGRPGLPLWQLMMALTYHMAAGVGSLASHLREVFTIELSDSALSQQRLKWGVKPFLQLIDALLAPLATLAGQPYAFYKDLRIMAIDGTQFSLINTPANIKARKKAKSRRSLAAFPKLMVAVLVEIGLHMPVAATLGLAGESEQALAAKLYSRISNSSLLLADRLYGCAKTLCALWNSLEKVESHFLVRVRKDLKVKLLHLLRDGSVIGELRWHDPRTGKVQGTLRVREIMGRVRRKGATKWSEIRLWTSLLDEKTYPASELLALYATRWEHELFYKILKRDLRPGPLLQSHTVITAGQELCALLVAAKLLAEERAKVALSEGVKAYSVSFKKVQRILQMQWLIFQVADGLISQEQSSAIITALMDLMRSQAILPQRRQRTCPRAIRQPVSSWPRLLSTDQLKGPIESELIPITEAGAATPRAPRVSKSKTTPASRIP